MLKRLLTVLLLTIGFGWSTLAAAEPSLHEVYQVAEQGRYIEAQGMMDQVLKNHPNSAKAHFVEAELLAKQGKLTQAATELQTAERLQPDLGFAKPQAVHALKTMLTAPRQPAQFTPTSATLPAAVPASGLPWGLILAGLGLIGFIYLASRFMQQRQAAVPAGYPGYGAAGPTYGAAGPGYSPMAPGGMAMPNAGGLGSGIMGGLATGAALGAGMVAGEALMHHFTDSPRGAPPAASPAFGTAWDLPADDMGGTDFGITDAGSWDSGSVSDDSWN